MALKEKLIHFFQLVEDGPAAARLDVDWHDWLEHLRGLDEGGRTVMLKTGEVFVCEVRDYVSLPHLVCHRFKDVSEWLNVRTTAGGISPLSDQVSGDVLETSAVSFLSYGSVFGLVRGSNSAPAHSQIATVISELAQPLRLLARPVTERAQLDELNQAGELKSFEIKVAADPHWSAEAGAFGVISDLKREHLEADVDVYLRVSVGRGQKPPGLLQRLKRMFPTSGAAQLPAGSRAKATVVNDAGDPEILNLVEHHLAISKPMGQNGLELEAAFTAIQEAGLDLETTIRQSIDLPD